MAYSVKRIQMVDMTDEIICMISSAAHEMNETYDNRWDYTNFNLCNFIENHLLLMCFRGEEPVGFIAASIYFSFFDVSKTLLRQDLLYSKYPKATYMLLKSFIDFGKANANHIITGIGEHTNLKPASLERLGFTKLESLYRMEV